MLLLKVFSDIVDSARVTFLIKLSFSFYSLHFFKKYFKSSLICILSSLFSSEDNSFSITLSSVSIKWFL